MRPHADIAEKQDSNNKRHFFIINKGQRLLWLTVSNSEAGFIRGLQQPLRIVFLVRKIGKQSLRYFIEAPYSEPRVMRSLACITGLTTTHSWLLSFNYSHFHHLSDKPDYIHY